MARRGMNGSYHTALGMNCMRREDRNGPRRASTAEPTRKDAPIAARVAQSTPVPDTSTAPALRSSAAWGASRPSDLIDAEPFTWSSSVAASAAQRTTA